MMRISTSSRKLREYADDEPDEHAERRGRGPWRCAETASSWPPPQRNLLQTSWPMRSVPKSRFDGCGVRLADERRGGVRRDIAAEHGDRDEHGHEDEPDARAPQPERAAQQAARCGRRAAATSGWPVMPGSAIALTGASSVAG